MAEFSSSKGDQLYLDHTVEIPLTIGDAYCVLLEGDGDKAIGAFRARLLAFSLPETFDEEYKLYWSNGVILQGPMIGWNYCTDLEYQEILREGGIEPVPLIDLPLIEALP